MRVRDKVWVVTGGASGIGQQMVLQLLDRGGRVAAVDRDPAGLDETTTIARAGERLSTHVVDITDRAATEALVADVMAAHGAVDALINNAGIIQPFDNFVDLDYADIDRVLQVNLMGTVHMLKSFLPVLLQRPEAHVANVSSMGGFFPFPQQTMYGATKAGVKLLTEGLYAELLDTPVRVSVIMPGPVETAIGANSGVVEPVAAEGGSRMPMMSASDAARDALDGIEADRLHIYLGPIARLSNYAIRIAPRRAIVFVRNQMVKMMASNQAGEPARSG
ncbi:MAG: SDR family NAD(P)-dependent oxidoreductase [Actinomycetales bacterium]|nr:SDR family NAD(P)-dependent oxidoreductase [Actinomycetales bacterium]